MKGLDNISFAKLIWVSPVIAALHNLEEAPAMARWSWDHLPQKYHPLASQPQFLAALVIVTVLAFLVAWISARSPKNGWGIGLFMGMQSIFLVNAATHAMAAIIFAGYAPGVVTGLLLNVPFALYLFRRAFRDGYAGKRALALSAAAGLVLYLPVVLGSLLLAGLITG